MTRATLLANSSHPHFQIAGGEMMTKRLDLIVLCCMVLSGCVFDPTFDTSNIQTFADSLAVIKSKLNNDDLRRLDVAMKYMTIESALPAQNSVRTLSDASPLANGMHPAFVYTQLRGKVSGKSANAVIKNLIIKLDNEIAQADGRLQNSVLANTIEVTAASYSWRRSGGRNEQPSIEFAVFNGGNAPISRIHFRIALVSPNRSIPWAKQDYVEAFKGGLEPREKRQLALHPYGDWSDPQLRNLPDAVLRVDVLNFEDDTGQKMISADRATLELKRKVRAALQ